MNHQKSDWKVEWLDLGREPKKPPNPDYPNGVDLDLSKGAIVTCTKELPYPAQGCGVFLVFCQTCNQKIIATTAGRPDDPRSIKLTCKLRKPGN